MMKKLISHRLLKFTPFVFGLVFVMWTYRPADIPKEEAKTKMSAPTYPKGCGPGETWPMNFHPHQKEGRFLSVNGTRNFLVSAFLEHRTVSRQVRVVAVILRSDEIQYQCVFCCEKKRHFSQASVDIHMDHYGFVFGTADIMCPVPSHCDKPSYVSVTTEKNPGTKPMVFMEVWNQEVQKENFTHNFSVCFTAMFDYDNALQLVQTVEMLKILGVSKIIVYRTTCSPQVQQLLDYYTEKGLMEVVPWSMSKYLTVSISWLPSISPGDMHYHGQIPAITDCIYRTMYHTKYLAMHDQDELFLPQLEDNWNELLPVLEETYGPDLCYKFKNHVFPNSYKLPPPNSHFFQHPYHGCCKSWDKVPGVNIFDHLYYEPPIHVHQSYKDMYNPRTVYIGTVHGLIQAEKSCVWVSDDIAHMYHTRPAWQPKLAKEYLTYDDRLLGYKARLVHKVNIVLKEVGLKPDSHTENLIL